VKKLVMAFAALLVAGVAHGQAVTMDGQTTIPQSIQIGGVVRADTTQKSATMSSTGGLAVYDEDRDRDKVTLWQNQLQVTALAIGSADSTGVIDVHAHRYLKILLKATPASGDTGSIVRLALQFREHMNSGVDSNSVFAEYLYGARDVNATSGADTLTMGHIAQGTAGSPWSGEYVVQISPKRSSPTSSVSVNGRVFAYPNGLSIPLDSFFGRPARFNKLSIRVRNLGANTVAGGATCNVTLHVLGFAQ